MKRNDIYVEAPRSIGGEIEFFLQKNEAFSVTCSAHIHNAVELLYVKKGSYTVVLDGYEYEIKEGDLTLFCSNSIHHVFSRAEAENEYYVIKAPPSVLLSFAQREMGMEYVMRFAINREGNKIFWSREELSGSEILEILDRLVRERESGAYASDAVINLNVAALLLAILRDGAADGGAHNTQMTKLIYDAIVYVREHYAQDIDERELARRLGVSYSYFSRSFKLVSSMSFKRYLTLTRIREAERKLCTGEKNVSEVATECGFNSISYFISVYKREMGVTPYKTRKGIKT